MNLVLNIATLINLTISTSESSLIHIFYLKSYTNKKKKKSAIHDLVMELNRPIFLTQLKH